MQISGKKTTLPALAFGFAGAIAASAPPAAAADGDLGPYFEHLRTAPPRTVAERPAAAPHVHRPVHRAALSPRPLDIRTLERTVFNHINLYRVAKGMRPLADHGGLAATARAHSAAMASGAAPISHDGMRGRLMPHIGYFGRRAGGEILAYNRGAGDPAQTALRSWINSGRHKDVIEEDYLGMGVGVAQRVDGAYYFTVLFLR
jgi:uncharacterized protein YkwD